MTRQECIARAESLEADINREFNAMAVTITAFGYDNPSVAKMQAMIDGYRVDQNMYRAMADMHHKTRDKFIRNGFKHV